MQNFLLVRHGANLLADNDDFQHSLIQLQIIVNAFEYFSGPDQCVGYLTTIEDEKIFLIVSERYGESIVSLIHNMSQIETIYVFCSNNEQQEERLTNWPKVKGIYSSIQSVCTSLNKVVLKCEHNLIPMSFVSNQILAAGISGTQNLDQLEPSYMYSMFFKEILLEIEEDDTKATNEFVVYCRNQRISDSQLESFQRECDQKSPIWCYSSVGFLDSMLNKDLRLLNMKTMIKMGFFYSQATSET
ncbi:unnamed protein product [Rotaria magnacalcarata]|uniref:Uncharacterized protein n=1 Tax=Rotaria magnacalcarata TaxID=392030 RepID=A0A819J2V1_9BILA|nr:unnamed protein product [Rotaria magnacalcarata]CAF2164525.1 unnamed protein product [Rotaria magnacalcarata]CAF3763497.1 unnamed protein product [Rotaria magnacalcarata]CAF3926895.1 unnamed protein product [Rotaria magnacalcarata]